MYKDELDNTKMSLTPLGYEYLKNVIPGEYTIHASDVNARRKSTVTFLCSIKMALLGLKYERICRQNI